MACDDKKELAKLKKPTEVSVSMTYNDETIVNAGTVDNIIKVYDNTYDVVKGENYESKNYSLDLGNEKIYEITSLMEYSSIHYNKDAEWLSPYGFNSLQEQLNSGKNISEVYGSLKNAIISNKSNPKALYTIISYIEGQLKNLYDSNHGHEDFGKSGQEMLGNILSTSRGDELKGFVCLEIHEFGMKLLHDCGVDAVMIAGKGTNSVNHACLLYKVEDGKYAFTNYGKTVVINANNLKDAAYVVSKACKSSGLETFGAIGFIDENSSYQEFPLKDECVWGHELDKKDYNFESPLSLQIAERPSISGQFNVSNTGCLSGTVQGTLAFGDGVKDKELSLALGMQKRNETALFDNSQSVGLKFEYKGKNNKNGKFFFSKAVVAHTEGNIELGKKYDSEVINAQVNTVATAKESRVEEVEYADLDDNVKSLIDSYLRSEHIDNPFTGEKNPQPSNENANGTPSADNSDSSVDNQVSKPNQPSAPNMYKTEHITTFLRGGLGKRSSILKDENLQLHNSAQVGATALVNIAPTGSFALGGDLRLAAEDGIELSHSTKSSTFNHYVSGGVLSDLKLTGGACKGGMQLGMKLNGGTEFNTRLNDNVSFGAKADGYYVVTKPTTEQGIKCQAYAIYKPNNSRKTIFGAVNTGYEKQQLRIGGFDECVENNKTFGITAGINFNDKTSLRATYNQVIDKANSTRSRQTFGVETVITL